MRRFDYEGKWHVGEAGVCFNCHAVIAVDDRYIVLTVNGRKVCESCELKAKAEIERLDRLTEV